MPLFYEPQGFVVDNQDLTLAMKVGDPLTFDENGALNIRLGDGLSLNAYGELVMSSPEVTPPVTFENSKLGLNYGQGLTLEDDTLQVAIGSGMTFHENNLQISLGEGLHIVENKITPVLGAGLVMRDGAITAPGVNAVEPPPQPSFSVSSPLYIRSTTNTLYLNIGDGLTVNIDNKSLKVNTGAGLVIEKEPGEEIFPGKLTLHPSLRPQVLWTTANPGPNVQWVDSSRSQSVMYLCLTRLPGGLVLGNLAFSSEQVPKPLYVDASSSMDLWILLDTEGNLRSGSMIRQPWEIQTSETSGNPSKRGFLPSSDLYPIESNPNTQQRSTSYTKFELLLGFDGCVSGYISFNSRRGTNYPEGHSIRIRFDSFRTIYRKPFATSSLTFSYWTIPDK